MAKFALLLAAVSAAIPAALAHGGVLAYSNAGHWYQGWYVRATITSCNVKTNHVSHLQGSVQLAYRPNYNSTSMVHLVRIIPQLRLFCLSFIVPSSNPITDATNAQIGCNDDGTSGALQLTATVSAGSTITAYWNQVWPHAIGPMVRENTRNPNHSPN